MKATFDIDGELYRAVKVEAARSDRSVREVVEEALEAWLARAEDLEDRESAEAALEHGLALSPDDYGCTGVSTCFDPSFDYAINGFEPFGGHPDRGWGGYWQANATGRIGGGRHGGDRAGSSGEGKKKSSSQHQKDLQHEDRRVRTEREEAQFVIFDDSGNP